MENKDSIPILISVNMDNFWIKVRDIFREEVRSNLGVNTILLVSMEVAGLTEKPLL